MKGMQGGEQSTMSYRATALAEFAATVVAAPIM
jgi:hypothetical protein